MDNPKKENFSGQIIFGTHYDFEFAIMRAYIYEKNVHFIATPENSKQNNPFEVVIVDEVDNLFIDSALNSARIAYPGKNRINWIYKPILEFVKSNQSVIKVAREQKPQELMGRIVIGLRNALTEYREGNFKPIVEGLKDRQLTTWINSAYRAVYELKINVDYVVKPVEGYKLRNQIVIVDKVNTGRLKENSRWQGGLHECLEEENGLEVEEESLTAASLCHPVFFNYYSHIFGLTGTIGEEAEREEVEKIYHVTTFDVPPHRRNQFELLEGKIVANEEEQFTIFFADITQMQEKQRPVLIFLESIEETERCELFLKQKGIFLQVLNERQSEDEEFIIARAGNPRMVTVATNTAGREADIILHKTSLENGGLHVIYGDFPINQRVEDQGFGRAARQGQPGSGRMILNAKKLKYGALAQDIATLKKVRSLHVALLSSPRGNPGLKARVFQILFREGIKNPSLIRK